MTKSKKIILVVCFCVLLFCLFCACTDNNAEEKQSIEEPTSMKLNLAGNYGVLTPIIFGDQALCNIDAEIYPFTASNNHVRWSVEWENPNSYFARDKKVTNYVEVYPREAYYDGYSPSAQIKYCQPFGEPVIVTCTSSSNPEIKDTCKVQCMQRIEGAYLELYDFTGANGYDDEEIYHIGADHLTMDINPALLFYDNLVGNETCINGDPICFKLKSNLYTKEDTLVHYSVGLKRSNAFVDKLNDIFGTYYAGDNWFDIFYDDRYFELDQYRAFDYGDEDLYINMSDFYCMLFRGSYRMKDLEKSNLFYQKGGKSDCLYNLYAQAVQTTEGPIFSLRFTLYFEEAGELEYNYDISYGGPIRQIMFIET